MGQEACDSVLIVSFSHVASDARVLRQIEVLRRDHAVTVVGYGELDVPGVEMVSIPSDYRANRPHGRLLQARLFSFAYWSQKGPAWVFDALRGRRWSAVVANDIESVPLAFKLASASSIHVDLHEYSPRMREHWPYWRRTYQPYIRWICRRLVSIVASQTTVSPRIAQEYKCEFGFLPDVVLNAPWFRDAVPRSIGSPLRLVHSGGAMEHRGIEELCAAVEDTSANVTLDLFLVPSDPAVMRVALAVANRCERVRVLDPVPPSALVQALAEYDIGVHLLKPVNFNHDNALPNKVFDYIQARLAVIAGPTASLSELVRDSGAGWVTEGFEPEDLARTLEGLSAAQVLQAKCAADRAAVHYCAEAQVGLWGDAVRAIVTRVPR